MSLVNTAGEKQSVLVSIPILLLSTSMVVTDAMSATAVSLAPGVDIQSVANAAPSGTTFIFQPGIYRTQAVIAKDGDIFDGQGVATLNGSRVLAGFTRSGNAWVVDGQTQHGQVNTGAYCASSSPQCAHPEDLFIDNVPMRHVGTLSAVTSGAWYFDYTRARIYIGDDPAGHTIETSVTPGAITGNANNVTVKGLTIEKYATPLQHAAVGSDGGTGWVITNNTIRLNHAVGVGISPASQVLYNKLLQNGQEGYAGSGADFVFDSNEVANNNYAGVSYEWEAGGGKVTETNRGGVIVNNCVHDNDGPGIWMDERANGVLVEKNIVWNNSANGIMYEISYDGVIRNNLVADNGAAFTRWFWGPQILISSSDGVQVYCNTVDIPAAYGNAITIVSQGRAPYTPAVNNNIYENTVTIRGKDWGRLGAVTDVAADAMAVATLSSMHSNVYHLIDITIRYWNWWGLDRTLTGMKSIGQERGSTADTNLPTKPAISCDFLSSTSR